MASIELGKKLVKSDGNEVYFIAEIGQNHQGDLKIAENLIKEAKSAKVDCVKFQKSDLESKFTKSALNRPYAVENSFGRTYGEHKKYLEFDEDQYKSLQTLCKDLEIDFTASAMDPVSLKFLDKLDVPFIKIGSGDANNFPMLRQAAKLQKPLIISTGMLSMKTIQRIVEIMRSANKTNFALMHCVSAYPTPPEDCNLLMIPILRTIFPDVIIGYSGHELGIEITKAAVLLGAKIVERHFTLSKTSKGSDHKCSLEPQELADLISQVDLLQANGILDRICNTREEVLEVLGDANIDVNVALSPVDDKRILESEWPCKNKLGKSVVAAKSIPRGRILKQEDVCIKVSEPPGVFAEFYDQVVGNTVDCELDADQPIEAKHLINKIF